MINRLETDVLDIEFRRFDLHQLICEVFADLEMMAEEKQITFLIREDNNAPCYVKADRERIRQVLVNLVSNSIKYGSENGKTEVSFFDMDGQTLLVEVADDLSLIHI